MILYHAGPVLIECFHQNYGGVHFGSYDSAIEAASRKGPECVMHCCEVNLGRIVPVLDLGNADAWEDEIKYSSKYGDSLEYTNKYEPSTSKSYVLMNLELLQGVKILSTSVLNTRKRA